MLKIQSAKDCIKDHFDSDDDKDNTITWLEGWICGYTDQDHEYGKEESSKVHDELFYYLDQLKRGE